MCILLYTWVVSIDYINLVGCVLDIFTDFLITCFIIEKRLEVLTILVDFSTSPSALSVWYHAL